MKQFLIAGASILALGLAPALAQDNGSGAAREMPLDYPHPSGDVTDNALTSEDIRDEADAGAAKDGSVRDAMGDPPVNPMADAAGGQSSGDDRSSAFTSYSAVPFPPQDVSDDDLEPYGAEYPSGPPRESRMERPEGPEGDAFTENEVVPEGIRRYQGQDMWEADDGTDVDADEGPSSLADKDGDSEARSDERAERESEGAWDGPSAGPPFHRGQLHEDRTPRQAEDRGRKSVISEFERKGDDRTASTRQQSREDRRLDMARRALRSARYAVPEARFRTYEFEIDDGRRVIEIAGVDLESGRRVEVDVSRNGRIRSISGEIPLEAVPDRIRQAIAAEMERFQVVHTQRTLRRGMELYYEFAGFNDRERPVIVEIRADGRGLTIRHIDQG